MNYIQVFCTLAIFFGLYGMKSFIRLCVKVQHGHSQSSPGNVEIILLVKRKEEICTAVNFFYWRKMEREHFPFFHVKREKKYFAHVRKWRGENNCSGGVR